VHEIHNWQPAENLLGQKEAAKADFLHSCLSISCIDPAKQVLIEAIQNKQASINQPTKG
jgi:hypothetical protein